MTWAPGKSFSGCLGSSTVSNLSVTISLHDIHPTPPPVDAHSCTGPEENDGLSPPLGSLPPESFEAFAEHPVQVDVAGPSYGGEPIAGTGHFGAPSVMAHHLDAIGNLMVDRWDMVGAEPASVNAGGLPVEVNRFRLSLVGPRVATPSKGKFTLKRGTALFHLYGSAQGAGVTIDAVNGTAIEIESLPAGDPGCESQAGCLESAPFTIEHVDAFGDPWQLDVGWGHWTQ